MDNALIFAKAEKGMYLIQVFDILVQVRLAEKERKIRYTRK